MLVFSTGQIISLIQQKKLYKGAYTVSVSAGVYANIMGERILVYTHDKPESDILAFNVNEFLLLIESARNLSVDSFARLIMTKIWFDGEIMAEK